MDCALHVVAGELRTTADRVTPENGFTLLEVLVATTLLFVAVASLAGLSIMATRANMAARSTTFASLLATQKMEQLRAETWNTLTPSPADALARNTPGYCDFVDAGGRSLGRGASPPAQAAFVRRWSIEPLPSNPASGLVLQVLVMRVRPNTDGTSRALPDDAAFVTVRTRAGT